MSVFQIDRRSIANFEFLLLIATFGLMAAGILNLASAASQSGLWKDQLYRLLFCLLPMAAALMIDYNHLQRLGPALYALALVLLAGLVFFGYETSGQRSWYDFEFMRFQPSELSKLAVIIMIARHYQRDNQDPPWGFRKLLRPAAIMGAPLFLIMLEPDLGTALIVMLVAGTMLLFIGIQRRVLVLAVLLVLVSIYPAWHYGLRAHQKDRILTFIHPERDPLGAGYNALQSKIAVGSGGLFGKGYQQGSMHMLRFLPEQQTDFVFSVWAEEWGFVWVVIILMLYLFVLHRCYIVIGEAKDRFGVMLAFGCAALLFWHIFINIAMVVGLFPVIGVPLPFMSYGGSSLLTFMIAVGLIINVRMRKYYF